MKCFAFQYLVEKGLPVHGNAFFKWAGLIYALRRVEVKECFDFDIVKQSGICIEEIRKYKSKIIYKNLLSIEYNQEVVVPKVSKYFLNFNLSQNMYKNIYIHFIDSKSRAFQYMFLHDCLINNYWLHIWKIQESNLCPRCNNEVENIEHVFWGCFVIKGFWESVSKNLLQRLNFTLEKTDIFFGVENDILNTIYVTAKMYIHN